MKKLLLLPYIKSLIIVLQSSTEYNNYLPRKKTNELSLCSKHKIYVLMVSTLAFVFKIRPIIFSAVKKVNFPHSRKFSSINKLFHSQGTFPQTRTFIHKNVLLDKRNFPQRRKFFTNKFFPFSWKFSIYKESFCSQEIFPQTNIFAQTKIFCKQKSKRFPKSQSFRSIEC